MRKIIIAAIILWSVALVASAHMPNAESPRNVMMQQMLGEDPTEVINDFEEQMMGPQTHERMEALMDKMFAGTLSAEEQKEMFDLMKTNVGANNMMMRGMMGQMMSNFGRGSDFVMMGQGWGLGWFTPLLFWVVLALGIAGLVKYLKT
ncbi:MAG: hypothetical protein HY545_02015 [Candidatus Doudnabacteria bacterium]|nr:hypothetical protein [Candidatus Doudnabacteria bacterium]